MTDPTPPDNELREQPLWKELAKLYADSHEPGSTVSLVWPDQFADKAMELIAQAKQAWTVEARRDEVEKFEALDLMGTMQRIERHNDYVQRRLAELQPPTAESEAEG